ncbi:MAG: universal stress protein [Desulfovibrio sp.]|jgi:K+-sensing histidine kinase KdpD|uniref:UspA domain-containing protein n=2 Tax=Nitratidesulfovibrio TaxID=2802295 RepID=B8DK63_NITV9|nr:universal stress protein [Nitratidesulfovibrio liaohensis]MDR3043912.1 universal stress protein [Desulfovibrio sp.]WMW66903.1 universal stress protein [Nitratidesulfovibrio liaohensis]
MERILVGIDERRAHWEALAHGCSLARRIRARLYVLFVNGTRAGASGGAVRQRLELLVGAAKAEGVPVEYFIAEGGYEDAIVSFVNTHGITLLIHEAAPIDHAATGHAVSALQALRHRISCRVEIVNPKRA